MLFRTKLIGMGNLLMDQTNSTEGVSGYGTGQTTTTDTSTAQATGNSGDTTTNTTVAQGTPNTETKTGDQSQQAATTEQKNVIGYSTENKDPETKPDQTTENKTAEGTTENKNDTNVEDLKIDTRGLPDDQTKDIIDFAKELKLTSEQAQSVLDKRKNELDKYMKSQEEVENTVKTTYTKWEEDLRTDWGKDYAPNIQIVNNTLTQHFPETAKMLVSSGKRLNPVQVKEFLELGKKLGDENTFEPGSSNSSNKKDRNPSDFYTN